MKSSSSYKYLSLLTEQLKLHSNYHQPWANSNTTTIYIYILFHPSPESQGGFVYPYLIFIFITNLCDSLVSLLL